MWKIILLVTLVALATDSARAEEPTTAYYFWAAWCAPCRTTGPLVERWHERHPEIQLRKLNYDADKAERLRFEIDGVPMLILVHEGRAFRYGEAARYASDFTPDKLDAWLAKVYP